MELLKKIFSSYVTTIVLLSLYATLLASATFIEKAHSTVLAKVLIYYSPLFILLQFLLVVNFILITIQTHLWKSKRWGFLFIHFSFIVILAGAMVTHLFGKEGVMHIREGETTNQLLIQTNHSKEIHTLPFQVQLIKFTLTRYPGSMSPSSYESELLVYVDGKKIHKRVYMNNVMDIKGYRFFQASFDEDEKGTVLTVNKDVAGRNITYLGYLILFIGTLFCFFEKKGRIRTLLRLLKAIKNESRICLFFLFLTASIPFLEAQKPTSVEDAIKNIQVPIEHAQKFGSIPVQSTNGRIIPMSTFSSEILRKLYKGTQIYGMNSDQFLISLLAMPEMWMRVPFITYSNDEIAHTFNLTPKRCKYTELFHTDGTYKLQEKIDIIYQKRPADRNALEKEIIKLDEKVNIFHQLSNYQLIRIFPKADDHERKWYAPNDDLSVFKGNDSIFVSRIFYQYLFETQKALKTNNWAPSNEILTQIQSYQYANGHPADLNKEKIELEIKYNKLEIFQWCRIGYLSIGGIMLILSFVLFFKNKRITRWIIRSLGVIVLIIFHYHMLGMGMRWEIGGYAPWSNSYETMVFLSWSTVFVGLLFAKKNPIILALGTLFAGIILFVSGLNWMDPQINPLVPVLKSPWLMFHVAIIMAAYGFFGVSFFIGLTNLTIMSILSKSKILVYKQSIKELSIINEISLLVGLLLMTVGTFMGAVWANESWGRYWGWDPKETWALITIIVYVIVTHIHLVKKWYNLWLFNFSSVTAFSSVLMTYFGVNYFLSGMHSYGHNDQLSGIFIFLYGIGIFILLLGLFSMKGRVLKEKN